MIFHRGTFSPILSLRFTAYIIPGKVRLIKTALKLEKLCGLLLDDFQRLADMPFFGRPLPHHQPDGVFPVQGSMSHKYSSGGVDRIQQLLVKSVKVFFRSAVVKPETNQAEIDRGQDLKPPVLLQFVPEKLG